MACRGVRTFDSFGCRDYSHYAVLVQAEATAQNVADLEIIQNYLGETFDAKNCRYLNFEEIRTFSPSSRFSR